MMKRTTGFFVVAAALQCSLSVAGAAPITVAGQVTNSSTDRPVAGIKVELWRLKVKKGSVPEGAKSLETTVADKSGRFTFDPLEVKADDLLTVRTQWQGAPYEMPAYDGAGALRQFGLDIKPSQIDLRVLDTASQLEITETVHHVAVQGTPEGMKCTERIVIENPTRAVYRGEGPNKVSYQLILPDGAQNVKLDEKILGAKLVKIGEGFGIAMPIWPTSREPGDMMAARRNAIIITYTMPWRGFLPWLRSVDLSRKIRYPVRYFFVNRTEADRALKVEAPLLDPDADQEIPIEGKSQVRIVNGKGSPMSDKIAMDSGTAIAITVSRPVSSLFWAFLIFVCALCVLPLALLGKGKTALQKADKNGHKIAEPEPAAFVIHETSTVWGALPEGSARDLIESIAQLDDEWERGAIEQGTYHTRRAELKKSLIVLMSTETQDAEPVSQ